MIVAVPKEMRAGERRVALTPAACEKLVKRSMEVRVEQDAGLSAGYSDDAFVAHGATIVADRAALLGEADIIVNVRAPGAQSPDLASLRAGQVLIGLADPLSDRVTVQALAARGISLFAMELIPRITRAQSMDVLSSQANLAGFKAVIRSADLLPRIFPMMMTAAGTVQPAKVFVVGAGVAGLQAIATAKRLGALVSAYDVRSTVKEQVQSLGAKFVELPLETTSVEDQGGYAREQSAEQVAKQRELMHKTVAESDVVITTALIPGKPAPKLVTTSMVQAMKPASVIVDLAAERGGNCELTRPGETYVYNQVTIAGQTDLVAGAAYDASAMYANNLVAFLTHLAPKGELTIDVTDEITAATLVTRDGQVVNSKVKEALGIA